jgi:hypothetical protein
MTSAGSNAVVPSSSRIRFGGNHRSHCAASPAPRTTGPPDQADDARAAAGAHYRGPRDRALPADPFSDHRRRHLWILRQDRPHPSLERRERRRDRSALILRWPIRSHRPIARRPADTQLPRDLSPRNPVRDKPPDQRPVLHRDHPSICMGGLVFDRRYGLIFNRCRHRGPSRAEHLSSGRELGVPTL